MLGELLLGEVIGVAHGEAQRLGLVAAGDDTAVVIGEHHDRATFQAGTIKLTEKPPKSFHWDSMLAVDDLLISHLRRRFDTQRLSAPHSVPLFFEIPVNLTMPPSGAGRRARNSHRNYYSRPRRRSGWPWGHLAAELVDAAGHDAPDQEFLVGRDRDGGVAVVGRAELHQKAPRRKRRFTVNSQLSTAMTMSVCLGSRERSTIKISPSYSPTPCIESPAKRT
jgi:hypothetical protein